VVVEPAEAGFEVVDLEAVDFEVADFVEVPQVFAWEVLDQVEFPLEELGQVE
jgi:hypothetical protein